MKAVAFYQGKPILVLLQDGLTSFYKLEDVALAIGFSRPGVILNHTDCLYLGQDRYLDLKRLNKVAKGATKTPAAKAFAVWAKNLRDQENKVKSAAEHIAKQKKPEASPWPFTPASVENANGISLKEAAEKIGMKHDEFITWLTTEGYLEKYLSNGHLKLSAWFKSNGFGKNPIADSGRVSNTVRITNKGLRFIKNRLEAARESSVLQFAGATAVENKNLEKEVDDLIIESFEIHIHPTVYGTYFVGEEFYRLDRSDLLKTVKAIIAQVKLKEKHGT